MLFCLVSYNVSTRRAASNIRIKFSVENLSTQSGHVDVIRKCMSLLSIHVFHLICTRLEMKLPPSTHHHPPLDETLLILQSEIMISDQEMRRFNSDHYQCDIRPQECTVGVDKATPFSFLGTISPSFPGTKGWSGHCLRNIDMLMPKAKCPRQRQWVSSLGYAATVWQTTSTIVSSRQNRPCLVMMGWSKLTVC